MKKNKPICERTCLKIFRTSIIYKFYYKLYELFKGKSYKLIVTLSTSFLVSSAVCTLNESANRKLGVVT